jgi:hypothetical protein
VATRGVVVEDSVARVNSLRAMYYLGKTLHRSRSMGLGLLVVTGKLIIVDVLGWSFVVVVIICIAAVVIVIAENLIFIVAVFIVAFVIFMVLIIVSKNLGGALPLFEVGFEVEVEGQVLVVVNFF